MKVLDLRGKEIVVNITPSKYPVKGSGSRSKLQGECGLRLVREFPYEVILEEFPIPGTRMKLDFFLPNKSIAIEIDGTQHDEFNSFFHGEKTTSTKFFGQVSRDVKKHEWCEINDFDLIRIKESKDLEWMINQLKSAS